MNEVAAILLAAGQSKRMGAFKPLLPFGDQTVIESCLHSLVEGGISEDSVVVVVGYRADDVRNHLRDMKVIFATNEDPTSEMDSSIAAGVQLLNTEVRAVVIALVDYPAVPPEVVSKLTHEWKKGARLLKPTYLGRGGHPVMIDMSLRVELMNLDPARGLKALFDRHPETTLRVEVDSPYVARDIDTWDDYVALYKEIFCVSPPGA
jgi:CTP:molybdopterin cytidylyltransferase MocA